MKILVLDDHEILRYPPDENLEDPHDYTKDEFTQTVNINQFVDFFFNKEWDEIWIDHDLGHPTKTGRTATKKIYQKLSEAGWKMKSNPIIRITTTDDFVAKILRSDFEGFGLRVIRAPLSSMRPYGVVSGKTLNTFDY